MLSRKCARGAESTGPTLRAPGTGPLADGAVNHPARVALRGVFGYAALRANYLTHLCVQNRILFQEVPKAGCTVVKRVLQINELHGRTDEMPGSHNDRTVSPLAAPLDLEMEMGDLYDPDGEWFRFTFVRNPFSRALSSYLNKLITRYPNDDDARNQRLNGLGFEAGSIPSFREFLERLVDARPKTMDIHWAPQTHLLATHNVRYHFMGRFETLQSDLGMLVDRIALDAPAEFISRPTDHVTGARSRLREYYDGDPMCADLVRRIYARDFATLGYGWDPRFA